MKTLPGRSGAVRIERLTADDLRLHDLGRSQRQPSLALRELLGALDGERCRFPGCTRHRKLHAHHVLYWSCGGATDLSNLVLLCSRHHTLVRQLGFSLVLHPDRKLAVTTPEGVPLLHHPGIPWGDPAKLDPERRIDAETLPLGRRRRPGRHPLRRLGADAAVGLTTAVAERRFWTARKRATRSAP